MHFQQNLNRKGTQGTHRQELMLFFFAIFVFFAVNSSLIAAGHTVPFAPFGSKSIQVPFHEPFTRQTALSKSRAVKPCQTQSNHSLPLTNLDHEQPPSPVLSGIQSGSPETFGLQAARNFLSAIASATADAAIRGYPHFAFCILHSAFPSPLHHSTSLSVFRGPKSAPK